MNSREDWEMEQEKRKILQEQMSTDLKKEIFIKEIKNGLGEKIKKEPNKLQKKPSLFYKFKKLVGWS